MTQQAYVGEIFVVWSGLGIDNRIARQYEHDGNYFPINVMVYELMHGGEPNIDRFSNMLVEVSQ